MASEVQICNWALGGLGISSPIASLNENREEARKCKLFFEPALEQTLRDHPWNFAQKRRVLAETDFPEGYEDTFDFCYVLPNDCLHAHTLVDAAGSDTDAAGQLYVFEVALASDGASKVLVTNVENARLGYTSKITNPSIFDPLFARALSRRLAADLVGPLLKNNPQKVQETETLYRNTLAQAKTADGKEGKKETADDIPWIVARTR